MNHTLIVSLGASACLLGCASIESQESPSGKPIQGLSYYMPQKDFVVTLTVKGQKPERATIGTTAAYPDLSRQYVLQYGRNWLGKNSLDVTVTSTGLLSTAKSSTQSGVTDAFKGLASGVAGLQAMAFRPEQVGPACNTDGEYTFIFKKPGVYKPCAGAVTVNVGAPSGYEALVPSQTAPASEGAQAGIFYRQELPYLVTVTGGAVNQSAIVLSPSDSRAHFLPIARTFFSNNSADFGLVNGVPERYKQESDGEAVALFKLPADVLAAYFSAVGSLFDAFKTRDSKQVDALNASLTLELAKKKHDACMEALQAKDNDRIKALCN